MSNALSKDFNEEGQGLDDLGRLLFIIASIPQNSGLKRDDGVLKAKYSEAENNSRFMCDDMIHDVEKMAHISGIVVNSFKRGAKSVETFTFNFEDLLKKIEQIEPENAGAQLQKIGWDVYKSYEEACGRIRDDEDFFIYCQAQEIQKAYLNHLRDNGLPSLFPSLQEQAEAIKAKRALASDDKNIPRLGC